MKRIAIFASGTGTNALNIIQYFKGDTNVNIACILSNNTKAKVLEIAKNNNIESLVFSRDEFYNSHSINQYLGDRHIDLIVLSGFLWLLPEHLIREYPHRIINIHPALLPAFGGKGMYGKHVHESVKKAGSKITGITIHFVNKNYDEGAIIFQAECELLPLDSVEKIAEKVHKLEYKYYPGIIKEVLKML